MSEAKRKIESHIKMTSFTIHRAHLLPLLNAAGDVAPRRNTIPILGNVLITADGERLTVRATDLDRMVTASAPLAECEATGGFTVPALMLRDIVKALPESAQIAFEMGNQRVVVRSGRSRYQLNWLPESEFPDISPASMSHAFRLPGKALADIVGAVDFAISNEEARFYLNGIYMHVVEEELRFCATNGHVLGLACMDLPAFEAGDPAGMPGVILPAEFCSLLRKAGGDGEVLVKVSETKASIESSAGDIATEILSKMIDGTFPDYVRVIPQGNANCWRVDAAAVAGAARRAALVIPDKSKGLTLALCDGRLEITASSLEAGEGKEEIAATCEEGGDASIGFASNYLRNVMAAIGGDAVMQIGGPGDPARFGRPGLRSDYVIMPIRR